MGSFSYTCHLSGLPITSGTKCALLPLFPKEKWGYDNSQKDLTNFGKGNLCSNDTVNMYFDELFFPIFGKYDDYGGIENIEKDDNTKVLEEFFGLTIEQIAEVLCDCRRDEFPKGGEYCAATKILDKNNKKHMMLLKTSATWYHRGVFDKLAKIDSKDYFDKLDLGTHGILVALGFTFVGTDDNKRYNKVYEKDGLKIHTDDTWINIPNEQIYSIFDFKKYCTKNGVEINDKAIDGGRYSQLYDFVLPYVNDYETFTEDRLLIHMLLGNEYKVHSPHFSTSFQSIINKGTILQIEKMRNEQEDLINNNLTLFYFKKIKEYGNNFLKDTIVNWFNVKQYYFPTGRFLYPVGTSAQDGDHEKVQILLRTALEEVTEQINYYKSQNIDEDEEYENDKETPQNKLI
jgi:hypothetical protein